MTHSRLCSPLGVWVALPTGPCLGENFKSLQHLYSPTDSSGREGFDYLCLGLPLFGIPGDP